MSPLEFAELIIEEIYQNQRWASWGLFDNKGIADIKQGMDELAKLLVQEDKDLVLEYIYNTLGYYHNTAGDLEVSQLAFPYLDAYAFIHTLATSDKLQAKTRATADEICVLIDQLVVHSYYGQGFLPKTDDFSEGQNGVYLILPLGNKVYSQSGQSFWSHTNWFHPDDKRDQDNAYGLYDWCIDGATRGNQEVDNFYEYLDYLFDNTNTSSGGVNKYQW